MTSTILLCYILLCIMPHNYYTRSQPHTSFLSTPIRPTTSSSLPMSVTQADTDQRHTIVNIDDDIHNNHSQFPLAITTVAPLKFTTVDVVLWFQRFHARYRNRQLNDEELYWELLNCLEDVHLQRISHILRHQPPSFELLKKALIQAYDVSPALRQQRLKLVPALGDRTPSELLSQLRATLGKDDSTDETAKLLLLSEFLERMPPHVRQILRVFQDDTLDHIAVKADAILQDSYSKQFSYSGFHNMPALPQQPTSPLPTFRHPNNFLPFQQPHLTQHPSSYAVSRFNTRMPRSFRQSNSSPHNWRHFAPRPRSVAAIPLDRSKIVDGLCYYHLNYPQNPHSCVAGCRHYNPLNYQGGVSHQNLHPFRSTS